ncbi:hypothetical protein AAVH_28634 [Aphelenchoides avenae]|nr:hypothetical protein AAVH_28634 [Aphelenchus avenae]
MDTDSFPTDQDHPQVSSFADGDDEQLREALRESRQHVPLSSLAAGDAAEAAIYGEPSAQGEPQLEHDDFSASDASMSLDDLSDAPEMENDSDWEQPPRHAPESRMKKPKGRFACTECGRRFYKSSVLSQHQ